jgi:DNA repair protein RecO (recombination protein O)
MLHTTRGIVLRSIKYGETSLVTTAFTRIHGVQTYLLQGVRTSSGKGRTGRTALLQPASLLELVAYHKPGQHMHRVKEFNAVHIYGQLQEDVVKNSVALYSVELLLRLLPVDAPQADLFDFAFEYFIQLDALPTSVIGNFPLFFTVQCSRALGYTLFGNYDEDTPYLDLHEGGFTEDAPVARPFVSDEDARTLDAVLRARTVEEVAAVPMNAETRFRLLDWYIEFLHRHTQHLGPVKSLGVLRTVLH